MEQQLTFFLALAVGLVFGGLAVWLMLRADASSAYGRAKAELAAEFNKLNERLAGKETKIAELIKERDQLKAESDRQRQDLAALQASKAELEGRSEEKLAALNQAQEKLAETFRALSAEALESNNQAFLHLAGATLERFQDGAKSELESRQRAIDSMVQPISQSLGKVDDTIRELERNRAAAYAGISEQVKSLLDVQNLLRSETSNLVSALRTPTVRGRWGEMQLRRVVEMAGMVPHCDFEEQPGVTTEDGRLRPDMIVRLPGQRQVVVDAKVALKAYLEALDATDEETRQAKLAQHAAQVRSHLQKLGSKGYWDQLGSTPEFVVAFLPGEAFFSAALEKDPELIEFGIEHKVILSTPTTLIALLKAVSYGWRQEKLAHNAQEISNLGKTLYDRLCTFTHHLESMGVNLKRTVECYNRSVGSLESRVLAGARRFQDLGSGAPDKELGSLVPLDNFPRSLQAVEHAVSGGAESDRWLESPEEEEEILEAEAETGSEVETTDLDDGLEEDDTEEVVIEAVEGSNPLWLPGQLMYRASSPPLAEVQAAETASDSDEEFEELAPEVVEEAESTMIGEPPEETPEVLEVPACESEEEIPLEVLETSPAEPAENEVPEERAEDEVPATQDPGPEPAKAEAPSQEPEAELVEKGDGGRVNYLSFVKAM